MYLNQQLFQAPPTERQALADAITRLSPVSWQHINLQGKLDFSDEALTEALQFDLGAGLTVERGTDSPTQPMYHWCSTFNQGRYSGSQKMLRILKSGVFDSVTGL